MANVIDLINSLRSEASVTYQERVPEATRDNLSKIGDILSDRKFNAQYLEFTNALVGVIGLTIIKSKMYSNKLAEFKRGEMPLGQTIQEICVEMASAEGAFDPTGPNPLGRRLSKVQSLYFDKVRADKYVKSISRVQVRNAFRSMDSLERFLNEIVNSMYSGANLDEYLITKQMLGLYADNYFDVTVDALTSVTNDKKFIKTLKEWSSKLTYVHTSYNVCGLKTWTPKEDQILFIKADALAELDVEVLAGVFNLEKAVIPQRIIEVDDFGGMGNNVVALLVDKNILNIYDKDVFADTQHNADGAFDNHFLHVHQIYFMDHFSNAIRFVTSGAGVLIDPTITEGSEVTSMEIKSSSGVARTYIKAYSGDTITLTAKVPSGTTTSKVTVTGYSSATVSVASGVASISLTYDPTVNSGKVEIVVAN